MTLGEGIEIKHYRLAEKIGEGGMGVVWKAVDTRLDREVALKVLPRELADDDERLERFERESKAVAALNHPNIVTIYAFDRFEDMPYIAMELIDGQRLDEMIPGGGMPVERFLDLAIPISDAVANAHQRGVTHRDLKPANVMVSSDGRAKILDFGLAKLQEPEAEVAPSERATMALTQAGKLLGTVPYMSPEQVKGKDLDHRTDIFSLGTIFYEMATGKLPFEGDSSADMISSILRDNPALITESNPGMPPQLDRLLRHSLEKEPDDRYKSAAELRDELERVRRGWITGEISAARDLSDQEKRRVRTPRKAPRWLGAVGLVAVVAAVAAGVSVVMNSGDGANAAPASEPTTSSVPAVDATPSVAVLPFSNLSANPDNQYFSDGLTEEMINMLSRVDGLQVAARTSVFALKDEPLTIQEFGQRLGVAKVIEGSVRREQDRMRLNVKLINVSDGLVLWSEDYDRNVDDVFGVQQEISASVADALRVKLVDMATPDAMQTDSESYDLYLQGRFAWNKRTEDDLRRAIDLFRQATELDEEFALAYVGLADAFIVLPGYMQNASNEDAEAAFEMANEYALRALELKPGLAEALTSRAAYLVHKGQLDEAEAAYLAAIEAKPSYATAHHWYSSLLQQTDRVEDAIYHLKQAADNDPLSRVVRVSHARLLSDLGRYDESLELLRKVGEIDPEYPIDELMARTSYYGREFGESVAAYRRIVDESDLSLMDYERLAIGHFLTGQPGEALSTAKMAGKVYPDDWTVKRLQAMSYAALERPDRAVALMRQALEEIPVTRAQDAIEMLWAVRMIDIHGHEEEGRALARDIIAFSDSLPMEAAGAKSLLTLISSYLRVSTGEVKEGRQAFTELEPLLRANPEFMNLDVVIGVSGALAALDEDFRTARQREQELSGLAADDGDGSVRFWLASVAASLGESDRAVTLLREAFDEGYAEFMDVYYMPFFDDLHGTPEFDALLSELSLPPIKTAPPA